MQQILDTTHANPAVTDREKDFEDLILPLTERGYRLACAMLHDSHAAQDAVQEAALTAWRKLPTIHDRGRVRSWFLGIVVNECRNSRRLKWVSGVDVGLPDALAVVSGEERILRGEDLRRAIRQLGKLDRLAVILFFYVDLPLDEIALVLGSSVAAARGRLYRAVKRLRPDLEIQEALQ